MPLDRTSELLARETLEKAQTQDQRELIAETQRLIQALFERKTDDCPTTLMLKNGKPLHRSPHAPKG